MKAIVVRECAVRAIKAIGSESAFWGASLFFDICREAVTGEKVNFENDAYRFCDKRSVTALYEALAPDIISSVIEEASIAEVLDAVDSMPEAIHEIATIKVD